MKARFWPGGKPGGSGGQCWSASMIVSTHCSKSTSAGNERGRPKAAPVVIVFGRSLFGARFPNDDIGSVERQIFELHVEALT
jgi:hypothetical protein